MASKDGKSVKADSANSVHNLRQVPPSMDLLGYYRSRHDEFEKEREEYIRRIEQAKLSQEEYHDMKREVMQIEEENFLLRQELSQTRHQMLEIREEMLKLKHENDELKISELEDRRRIRTLLQMSHPVESETTYLDTKKPQHTIRKGKFVLGKVNIEKYSQQSSTGEKQKQAGTDVQEQASGEGSQEANEFMRLELESMRAHLEDMQNWHQEKLVTLMQNKNHLEIQGKERTDRDEARIEQGEERCKKLEHLLNNLTKEHCQLRHQYHIMERRLVEDNEELGRRAEQAAQAHDRTARKAKHVVAETKREAEEKTVKLKNETRATVQEAQQKIRTMSQAAEICEEENRTTAEQLRQRMRVLENQCKKADQRRKLEVTGYKAAENILRKELAEVENELIYATDARERTKIDIGALEKAVRGTKKAANLTQELRQVKTLLRKVEKDTFSLP